MTLALLVFGRIVAGSWSNVLQKRLTLAGLHPALIVTVTFALLAIGVAPALAWLDAGALPRAFWMSMMLAALFETPGNVLLVQAIRLTDLSLFGPLNAYKPVVALLPGILLLGEVPSLQGLAGIGIILLGSFFLSPGGERAGFRAFARLLRERGFWYRILSLVFGAVGAIFLKAAMREATPEHTFMAWALLNVPMALLCLRVAAPGVLRTSGATLRRHAGRLLGLALLILAMQYLTLAVFDRMLVSYALALFQVSMVLNVLFGFVLFREAHTGRRAFGSLIMLAGAAVILLG
ncbi:MAG: EamA/RhaT family transporter [Bacteroidetes bacterium]|nr:hypothetical protein AWN76_007775 [Rhodothermaceae bacterium RA]RMH67119.1 MAG: EamA/RhaT family transporter [Bacteroidota bacterium]